jgi:hypothetical protein
VVGAGADAGSQKQQQLDSSSTNSGPAAPATATDIVGAGKSDVCKKNEKIKERKKTLFFLVRSTHALARSRPSDATLQAWVPHEEVPLDAIKRFVHAKAQHEMARCVRVHAGKWSAGRSVRYGRLVDWLVAVDWLFG